MHIHEYQAKGLFRQYNIQTPSAVLINSTNEAKQACSELGGNTWVVKAQVHAGGRGKGGGVICARKEGKTPGDKLSETYNLEYGTATLELQSGRGEVVIVDDVLATGGTLQATNNLAKKAGYDIVGKLVAVDLQNVPRVDNFDITVRSVIQYG